MIELNDRAEGQLRWLITSTPVNELYSQLAEEACELAQAALKMNRVNNIDNPTPISETDAYRNLIEEYTDLLVIAENMLELKAKQIIAEAKIERWYQRVKSAKGGFNYGCNETHTGMDC